jgi:hypothetical protein
MPYPGHPERPPELHPAQRGQFQRQSRLPNALFGPRIVVARHQQIFSERAVIPSLVGDPARRFSLFRKLLSPVPQL